MVSHFQPVFEWCYKNIYHMQSVGAVLMCVLINIITSVNGLLVTSFKSTTDENLRTPAVKKRALPEQNLNIISGFVTTQLISVWCGGYKELFLRSPLYLRGVHRYNCTFYLLLPYIMCES